MFVLSQSATSLAAGFQTKSLIELTVAPAMREKTLLYEVRRRYRRGYRRYGRYRRRWPGQLQKTEGDTAPSNTAQTQSGTEGQQKPTILPSQPRQAQTEPQKPITAPPPSETRKPAPANARGRAAATASNNFQNPAQAARPTTSVGEPAPSVVPSRQAAIAPSNRTAPETRAPVGSLTTPPAPEKPVVVPTTPPPPPPGWSEQQVVAGLDQCLKLLSGKNIAFDALLPIKQGECGLPAPILLKSFQNNGAALEIKPAPTTSCAMASALHRWIDEVVQPQAKVHLNAAIVRFTNASAFVCRTQYNEAGRRLSEHATGNALDISEFVTSTGEVVTPLDHWNAGDKRAAFLRAVHAGACRFFGTTLGPEANAAHKNHFHLDMTPRRQGICDFTPEQIAAKQREDARAKFVAAQADKNAALQKTAAAQNAPSRKHLAKRRMQFRAFERFALAEPPESGYLPPGVRPGTRR